MGLMSDVVGANCMNVSSPNVYAFIPSAATPAALAADVMLSSMNVIGDWWLEGAGAIAAENHDAGVAVRRVRPRRTRRRCVRQRRHAGQLGGVWPPPVVGGGRTTPATRATG